MNDASLKAAAPFRLRLRGVRGSIPTPCASHLGFGGNTACVEVETGAADLIVIDAGTGIRSLGAEVMARSAPPPAIHIFFTHFHWDHVQGLPYFAPLFAGQSEFVFHSAHPPELLREVLDAQMRAPYFPIRLEDLPTSMRFEEVSGEGARFGDLTLRPFPLNHPQGSVGYRLDDGTRSVVYATDHEHGDKAVDSGLRHVAEEADVLIYDAQYTPEEYQTRRGWGHSTWLDATDAARDAGVGRLVLFHHDPGRDDGALAEIEDRTRQVFAKAEAAREGSWI